MNIFILGRGAWGGTIGGVVERLKHNVTFVGHADPAWPAVQPDYILVALPVQHVRETLEHFPPPGAPVLSLSKGLEIKTGTPGGGKCSNVSRTCCTGSASKM